VAYVNTINMPTGSGNQQLSNKVLTAYK